jgi:hypothetical protein
MTQLESNELSAPSGPALLLPLRGERSNSLLRRDVAEGVAASDWLLLELNAGLIFQLIRILSGWVHRYFQPQPVRAVPGPPDKGLDGPGIP